MSSRRHGLSHRAAPSAFGWRHRLLHGDGHFSGVRSRVEDAEPPASFEGLPITLVSAAIVSLSFFGFSGVLDRLFG